MEGPEEFKDINAVNAVEGVIEGFLPRGRILGKWLDMKGHKSAFFYVIGPADENILNTLLPPPSMDPTLEGDDIRRREDLRKDMIVI